MKFGEDGMKINARCAVSKSKKNMKKGDSVEVFACTILSSVTTGTTHINISDKNIVVSLRTQDLLAVMNAANQKYMDMRHEELGTPWVKDNISHSNSED